MKKKLCFIALGFFALVSFLPAVAQKETHKKEEKKHERFKARRMSDSALRKDFGIEDTSSAMIINRIEDINNSLNDFNDVVVTGFDSSDIVDNLPAYEQSLKFIKYSVTNLSNNLSLNRLNLFRSRLDDICDDMKDWQSSLTEYYTELVGMSTQMRAMFNDSTLRDLPVDSTLHKLYINKLKMLKSKWTETDSITHKNILKVDLLQNTVSNDYMNAIELQNSMKALITAYELKAFSKEKNYLWEKPGADSSSLSLGSILRKSFKIANRILSLYVDSNTEYFIIDLAILIIFFLWIYLNIRKVRQNNPASLQKLVYVLPAPFLASFVVMLVIAPFLDLEHPPTIYLAVLQILLIIPLSFLIARKWPKQVIVYWWLLVAMLVFYSIRNLLINTTYASRVLTFGLNLFSVVLGYLFIRQLKSHASLFPRFFKAMTIVYILLNIVGAACNMMGRVTLAQMFSSTAISNFIQVIGLVVFIEIFLEALFLQLEADSRSKRFTAYLNYQNIQQRLRNFLLLIAAIFWFINLTQNLNVFDMAYDYISNVLTTERAIGNSSYTLGSIATFFFVLWIANLLQKYIGYFFGDTGDDMMPEKKSKFGTSVLLIRLLLLTAGFFVGIIASGIPLDKVTIIIGALGVGIGLGLQNIVNNLVSGVILAIERPIQVGDIIEVGSSTGRVKEIGIRSSRIITPDGAEVIIPNGDMLSQKLINWTLNNSHLRVEMNIKLLDVASIEKTKKIILDILQSSEDIMKAPEPQIIISNISSAGADVQILFWAFDINKWIQLKSDTLQKIYENCSKENINLA